MAVVKTIAILGDTHCGSRVGLTPPNYWNPWTPDAVKQMWAYWEWCIAAMPKKVDLLILNGDLVDGKQQKSSGVGILTSSMSEQTQIAIEAMEPMCAKAKKIIRTIGTPYHEGFDGALQALDERYDIKPPANYVDAFVRDIALDDDGRVLNVAHHPDGGAALYKGTVRERNLLWATVAEKLHKLPDATHIVRSHLHYTDVQTGFRKWFAACPAWKLADGHAIKQSYYRWQPNIGMLIMTRDDLQDGGYRINTLRMPVEARRAKTYEEL